MELPDQLLAVTETVDKCAREITSVFMQDSDLNPAHVQKLLSVSISAAIQARLTELRDGPQQYETDVLTVDEAAVLRGLGVRLEEAAGRLSDEWQYACLGISQHMMASAVLLEDDPDDEEEDES